MAMTLTPNAFGGLSLRQRLVRPVVYLDHWAVRRFSDEEQLGSRFIAALHAVQGTWLFSQVNLSEFCAMQDVATARRVEALIERAFPNFYVIDTLDDTPYFREERPPGPRPAEAPDKYWILEDLARRALVTGRLNSHRFISDAIDHRDMLLPIFEQMKLDIASAVTVMREHVLGSYNRKMLVPRPGMRLIDIFKEELLIEPFSDPNHPFTVNDAVDFVHALPACQLCDLVLLDSAWCNRIRVATRRIRSAGLKGRLADCYSPRTLSEFFTALQSVK